MPGAPKSRHLACTLAAVAAVATAAAGCDQTGHPRPRSRAPLTVHAANGAPVASAAARRAAANFARAYARSADGRAPRATAAAPALVRQLRVNAGSTGGDRPLPPLHLVALSVTRRRQEVATAVATFRPGPGLAFRVAFTVEQLGRRWLATSVDGTGAGS